jgi:hypothetical protein
MKLADFGLARSVAINETDGTIFYQFISNIIPPLISNNYLLD